MLRLTGFVLPDVGLLTMTAWVGKRDPGELTREDLDEIAEFLEGFYKSGIGRRLAHGVVFPNSGFFQFSKPELKQKLDAYATFVLRGYQKLDLEPTLEILDNKEYRAMVLRGIDNAPRCAFTGDEAYLRVSREMLPLLNGRGITNFSPMGEAGLPVSAEILLAIHALPFGCVMTQGALLAVESEDTTLMFELIAANLKNNRRFLNLIERNKNEKYPNQSFYKSKLIEELIKAMSEQKFYKGESFRAPALNAYHFSNYGTNARVTIHSLPSSTIQFVWEATKDEYRTAWQSIVASAHYEEKSESEELQQKDPVLSQRILFYEDLFALPDNAAEFLSTYFLRRKLRRFKNDPRENYNIQSDADLLSWKLTALFLKRMMNMKKTKIEEIAALGDRLADYISEHNRKKVLHNLYTVKSYPRFRDVLINAIRGFATVANPNQEPLVTLDGFVKIFVDQEDQEDQEGFIKIFEDQKGFENPQFYLLRDLLLIRIFEQLHRKGYLSKVADELLVDDEEENE